MPIQVTAAMSKYDLDQGESQTSNHADVDEGDTSGGLSFTDNISVSWSPVDLAPDDAQLAKVNESNETFLRAVSALGSLGSESFEEDQAVSAEIARLDMKVDMLLDLVSQLIYAQLEIPPRTQVTISSEELQWNTNDFPPPGEQVFMQVYVQHGTPKPLCFYGQIISTAQDHDVGIAKVNYVGLSDSARRWLEKLIFRHHRREIAYARQKRGTV